MYDYEKIGWWDFIGAEHRSLAYQKLIAHGITRSLVAAKAREASTKTIGDIFVQLLFDIVTPGPSTDRVLNGPTNDVWIDPWRRYLESQGVAYHVDARATAVAFDGERIRSATIDRAGSSVTVDGRLLHLRPASRGRHRSHHARDDQGRSGAGLALHAGRHHRVDERDPDLPQGRAAARPRPQHLRGYTVGADLDFPGPVLART